MKKESKIILFIVLFALNLIVWFGIFPKTDYLIEKSLAEKQLHNALLLVSAYKEGGGDYVSFLDYDSFVNKLEKSDDGEEFCLENYRYNLCIDSYNNLIEKNKRCENGKCI